MWINLFKSLTFVYSNELTLLCSMKTKEENKIEFRCEQKPRKETLLDLTNKQIITVTLSYWGIKMFRKCILGMGVFLLHRQYQQKMASI